MVYGVLIQGRYYRKLFPAIFFILVMKQSSMIREKKSQIMLNLTEGKISGKLNCQSLEIMGGETLSEKLSENTGPYYISIYIYMVLRNNVRTSSPSSSFWC